MMKVKPLQCAFFMILLSCFSLFAQPQISVNGYYKTFFMVFKPVKSALFAMPSDELVGMVNQRLRLQSRVELTKAVAFNCAYDLTLSVQDRQLNLDVMDILPEDQYRFDDLQTRLYPEEAKPTSFQTMQNLDRAFLYYRAGFADIYAGRQVVSWGSGRVINPTDVLLPFMFNELDKEERRGVDAFRMRIPLGIMSELDVGYIAGSDLQSDQSAAYVRAKFYRFQSDISVLAMRYYDHALFGVDMARSVGGAGIWFEGGFTMTDVMDKNSNQKDNYIRISMGSDYSLTKTLYGFIEYHYNGAGSNRAKEYLQNFMSDAYMQGSVYLMGKHYLMPGFQYQLRPLISLSGQVLWNLSDQSLYLAPVIEYNVAQNVYVSGGAYIGAGQTPEGFDVRSEFGTYPDFFYSSFRIYF